MHTKLQYALACILKLWEFQSGQKAGKKKAKRRQKAGDYVVNKETVIQVTPRPNFAEIEEAIVVCQGTMKEFTQCDSDPREASWVFQSLCTWQ